MAEVYVTLGEAAELERVKYNTMVKRVLRKQESFVTKTEKSENGGKDVVLVAVSSLSKQARNAWKEREKLKSFTEEFPDKKEDEQKPEVPWYVNTDVDWYIENYKERYYKAVELGNVVRKFLQYDEGDRTKYAEEFAQKYLGKGQRTLYRYTKAYLEASAWADKLEKEDGAGREFFKVLCLCRKPKETGCFPSIKPEVKQVIKNIWFNEDFARNQGTREMLYEKLTAIANINKWEKIPSYQTVTRYISYLMEDEGMRNAWFLASRGTREYKNKVMVKGSRDTKGLQVMQIVMGDEHTFDCWVSYKQPNGKVIRYVLACAGIEDYVLSDEHYGKKDLFVIDRKSGINTIAEVNSSWGIKNPFFFQKKVFYWGTKEEQKEIYVLEEGETILSLNKYGDLWEAETIAIPWIHHSQEVEVQHSKYSGIVTVEKTIVRSDDTGAVHMYIYFAGGEKDV